jgi:[acyl-carrier-protein] S-malonyltransferase
MAAVEGSVAPQNPNYLNFPGQGSQSVGMSEALYAAVPEAAEMYDMTDQILGYPLRDFSNSETMLARTRFTQPTILSNSYIRAEIMKANGLVGLDVPVEAVAGHSVGLFGAMVEAGVTDYEGALKLVDARAIGMQHASDLKPGRLESVLGLTEAQALEAAESIPDLYVAVINEDNSVVMGGTYAALEAGRLAYKKINSRTKAKHLEVDGAFHTPLMGPAADIFGNQLERTKLYDPEKRLYANTSARVLKTADAIRQEAAAQLVNPVRWHDVVEAIHADGYTNGIEPSDKQILSNIRKRRHGGHVLEIVLGGAAAVGGTALALGTAYFLHEHDARIHEEEHPQNKDKK